MIFNLGAKENLPNLSELIDSMSLVHSTRVLINQSKVQVHVSWPGRGLWSQCEYKASVENIDHVAHATY